MLEHALRSLVETALRSTESDEGRIAVTVELLAVPPTNTQALLQLAGVLVGDALKHSFDPNSVGSVRICLDRICSGLQLTVEDDGWQPRSPTSWLADNRVMHDLATAVGGWLRHDVEWACNRVIVTIPTA